MAAGHGVRELYVVWEGGIMKFGFDRELLGKGEKLKCLQFNQPNQENWRDCPHSPLPTFHSPCPKKAYLPYFLPPPPKKIAQPAPASCFSKYGYVYSADNFQSLTLSIPGIYGVLTGIFRQYLCNIG